MTFSMKPGSPHPFGTRLESKGVNFAVYASGNPEVKLILRDPVTNETILEARIPYHTGEVKHVFMEGLAPPFVYTFEIDGYELLDPYAKLLSVPEKWGEFKKYEPKGLVIDTEAFDWSQDKKPSIPKEDLILYEMHVRGLTQDSSSHVNHPGTYLGMIEKIPHLLELGINAVELLPVQEFNENEYLPKDPAYLGLLHQFWGYSTVSFFSPMTRFASNPSMGGALHEFKQLVLALHQAGIEVILDVVFNHTSEGNEFGPLQSFKGLGNNTFYMMESHGKYANYSGCGNTFNCNHPICIDFIIHALQYWVTEMHVDGFRFDLASIFYRGSNGHVLRTPPLVDAITKDPILADVKLISEPWDAAGLYQVGSFFPESIRWAEWNGRYRDCMRRFLKGTPHLKGEFATRLSGSEDLYGHDLRLPRNSVNFIISHDGFTLRDLVSYNFKHNLANGENNQDGMNQNDSWNCGEEGPSDNSTILQLRQRQMKNFHLALMVSQGMPMLHMGDEYGHTKEGNNNTWCQDNRLSWFLWDKLKENGSFFRFYRGLIHFRKSNPLLRHRKFLRDDDIEWHGKIPCDPLWEIDDQFVSFVLLDKVNRNDLYIAFNAFHTKSPVQLPERKDGKSWAVIADTALESPHDFEEEPEKVLVRSSTYHMESYSSLILMAI